MNPYPSAAYDPMTDMAQELKQGLMTKVLAEGIARKILGGAGSIQAVMIIDDLGEVLAHARAEGFDVENEGLDDALPSLLSFPDHKVLVFLRLPSVADPTSLYESVLGKLEGYGN